VSGYGKRDLWRKIKVKFLRLLGIINLPLHCVKILEGKTLTVKFNIVVVSLTYIERHCKKSKKMWLLANYYNSLMVRHATNLECTSSA